MEPVLQTNGTKKSIYGTMFSIAIYAIFG